jgi:hypothetical protein
MNLNYPITYTPENSRTYAFRQAVPIRYACPVLPGNFMQSETDAWNCNLCGSDIPFYIPYVQGDVIPFQTQYADKYNQPNSVLTAGFFTDNTEPYYVKVNLYDCCGNLITDNIAEFSESYHVGQSLSTGSIQTWFVNTGMFTTGFDCFRLKVEFYKLNQITLEPELDKTLWTEYYKAVEDCGNLVDTSIIYSTYANFDCNGNFYGTLQNYLGSNNTAFYNSLRIFGTVEFFGDTEAVVENDRNVVISKDITENYGIISAAVPPFYIRLLQQAVRGNYVTVDGVQYQNFRYDSKPEDNRMFLLDLSFDKKCRLDNKQCR